MPALFHAVTFYSTVNLPQQASIPSRMVLLASVWCIIVFLLVLHVYLIISSIEELHFLEYFRLIDSVHIPFLSFPLSFKISFMQYTSST